MEAEIKPNLSGLAKTANLVKWIQVALCLVYFGLPGPAFAQQVLEPFFSPFNYPGNVFAFTGTLIGPTEDCRGYEVEMVFNPNLFGTPVEGGGLQAYPKSRLDAPVYLPPRELLLYADPPPHPSGDIVGFGFYRSAAPAILKQILGVVPGVDIFVDGSTYCARWIECDYYFYTRSIHSYRIPDEQPVCGFSLAKVAGDGQESGVQNTLPDPLVVKVADDSGNPVPDIEVNWTITGPDGATGQTVSATVPNTGADGKSQATVTLGNKAGQYQITATCPKCTSGSPVIFTATASAKILSIVSGDGQEGVMETTFAQPLVVAVKDQSGNAHNDVTINWTISQVPAGTQGAGLSADEVTTDDNGLAGVFLTLGDTEGDYIVTVTCPDCTQGSPLTFTAKAKCAVPVNAVTPLSQCGGGAGSQQYDDTSKNICAKGCALTALTMLLDFYGIKTDVVALNDWLKANGGYKPNGDLFWPAILQFQASPFTNLVYTNVVNLDVVNQEIRSGNPVIVKIPGSLDDHYVIAFCKSGSTYKVWDPGHGTVSTINKDQIQGVRILR